MFQGLTISDQFDLGAQRIDGLGSCRGCRVRQPSRLAPEARAIRRSNGRAIVFRAKFPHDEYLRPAFRRWGSGTICRGFPRHRPRPRHIDRLKLGKPARTEQTLCCLPLNGGDATRCTHHRVMWRSTPANWIKGAFQQAPQYGPSSKKPHAIAWQRAGKIHELKAFAEINMGFWE